MVDLHTSPLLRIALIVGALALSSCVRAAPLPDCKQPLLVGAQAAERPNKGANRLRAEEGVEIRRLFTANASGLGSTRLGRVEVKGNVAEIEIDGKPVRGFVYTTQDWVEYGYTLLDVIVTEGGAYTVLYLYCRGDQLTDVYWESYSDSLQYEKLSGSCALIDDPSSTRFTFEPVGLPPGELVKGYTVQGPNIAFNPDGTGTITIMDTTFSVRAFSFVGCTDCVTAQRRGWEELHVHMTADGQECFGVLYLYGAASAQGLPVDGQAAQLGYGFCTRPRVKDLPNTLLQASWSVAR